MKTKLLLVAALIGAAAVSAQAGIRFGFSFGLPAPVVVAVPSQVVVAPPVVVRTPIVSAPAVVVTTPACPGPDYVWMSGYWSVKGHDRVWVAGSWQYRPKHVVVVCDRDRDRDHGYSYDRDRNHGWNHR